MSTFVSSAEPQMAPPTLTPVSQSPAALAARMIERPRAAVVLPHGEIWVALVLAPALVLLAALLLAFPGHSPLPAAWQDALVSWRALALDYQADTWAAQTWAPVWALLRAPFAAVDTIDRHSLADPIAAAFVLAIASAMLLALLRSLSLSRPLRWLIWAAFFVNPLVLLTAGAGSATVALVLLAIAVVPALWRWAPSREAGPVVTAGFFVGLTLMMWYAVVPVALAILAVLFMRTRTLRRLTTPADDRVGIQRSAAVEAVLSAYLVPVVFAAVAVLWTRVVALDDLVSGRDPLLAIGSQSVWWSAFGGAFADLGNTIGGWSFAEKIAVAAPAVVAGLPLLTLIVWAARRGHPGAGAGLVGLAILAVGLLTLVGITATPFVGQLIGPLMAALVVVLLALSALSGDRQLPFRSRPAVVASIGMALAVTGSGTLAVALAVA